MFTYHISLGFHITSVFHQHFTSFSWRKRKTSVSKKSKRISLMFRNLLRNNEKEIFILERKPFVSRQNEVWWINQSIDRSNGQINNFWVHQSINQSTSQQIDNFWVHQSINQSIEIFPTKQLSEHSIDGKSIAARNNTHDGPSARRHATASIHRRPSR